MTQSQPSHGAPPQETGGGTPDSSHTPRRHSLWRRLLLGLVLAVGFSAVAVVAGFLAFTTQIATREPKLLKSVDAIVVLTGGEGRVIDAVSLLAKGYGQRLLITGVNPTTSPGELRRALSEDDWPDGERLLACCIDLGHKALNTRGNAIEAAEWTREMNFHSLVVVTSTWHMPRALVELNRSLPDVELIAYPVVTSRMDAQRWWRDPAILQLLFKEYLKYVMARVKIRPAQAVAKAEDVPPQHYATQPTTSRLQGGAGLPSVSPE
ncbi:MAG: YdcF family protein [Xanthobacter sp.]